jgi:hypothetical protein
MVPRDSWRRGYVTLFIIFFSVAMVWTWKKKKNRLLYWRLGPPCNVQRWDFGEVIGSWGPDLINALIHWWSHDWMDCWEVVETWKVELDWRRWVARGGPLKDTSCHWLFPLCVSLCFLAAMRWALFPHHAFLSCQRPKSNGGSRPGTEITGQNNCSSFKLFFSGILSRQQKWLTEVPSQQAMPSHPKAWSKWSHELALDAWSML